MEKFNTYFNKLMLYVTLEQREDLEVIRAAGIGISSFVRAAMKRKADALRKNNLKEMK